MFGCRTYKKSWSFLHLILVLRGHMWKRNTIVLGALWCGQIVKDNAYPKEIMTSKGWEAQGHRTSKYPTLNPYNWLWVLVPYSVSLVNVLTTRCIALHLWNLNAFRLMALLPHHIDYLPFLLPLSTVYLETLKNAGDAISLRSIISCFSCMQGRNPWHKVELYLLPHLLCLEYW